MTMNPQELTLEEIEVQIALFQRLYYQKMKPDPEFVARKNEKARICNARRRERERQLRPPKEKVEKPEAAKQPKSLPSMITTANTTTKYSKFCLQILFLQYYLKNC